MFAALSSENILVLNLQVAYFLIFTHLFKCFLLEEAFPDHFVMWSRLSLSPLTFLSWIYIIFLYNKECSTLCPFVYLSSLVECKPCKGKVKALLSALCLVPRRMIGTYYQLNKIQQINTSMTEPMFSHPKSYVFLFPYQNICMVVDYFRHVSIGS